MRKSRPEKEYATVSDGRGSGGELELLIISLRFIVVVSRLYCLPHSAAESLLPSA